MGIKIKNKIDMLVALAIVGGNLGELSRVHQIADAYGIKNQEIENMIDDQMCWYREQGYETLICSYLNPN